MSRALPFLFFIILAVCGFDSAYTVNPDEEALIIRFNGKRITRGPGLHFKTPFLDKVHIYNKELKDSLLGEESYSVTNNEIVYDLDVDKVHNSRQKFANGRINPRIDSIIETSILDFNKPKYEISIIMPLNKLNEINKFEKTVLALERNNYKYTENKIETDSESIVELNISYSDNKSEFITLLKNKRTVSYMNKFILDNCPNQKKLLDSNDYKKLFFKIYNMSLKVEYHDRILSSLRDKMISSCENLYAEPTLDQRILSLFISDENIPEIFKSKKEAKVKIPQLSYFKKM